VLPDIFFNSSSLCTFCSSSRLGRRCKSSTYIQNIMSYNLKRINFRIILLNVWAITPLTYVNFSSYTIYLLAAKIKICHMTRSLFGTTITCKIAIKTVLAVAMT